MEIYGLGKQAALVRLASEGMETHRIAKSAEAIWDEVDSALSPIIGSRGVSALFRRSVHLLRADYSWLQSAYDGRLDDELFVVLRTALSQQLPSTAAAANGALLQAFYHLLANLIGGSLTTRLLRSALENPSSESVAQEIKQ